MPKFFAKKLPNLEIRGEDMIAGDVSFRNVLQNVVPYDRSNSREAWFFSVSQRTGIAKKRVKSIFYNRQCRVWADELARIQRAQAAKLQTLNTEFTALRAAQGETAHETLGEIRSLLASIVQKLGDDDPSRH